MFGAAGDGARAWWGALGSVVVRLVNVPLARLTFLSYFLFDVCAAVADVHILGQRRVGYVTVHVRA